MTWTDAFAEAIVGPQQFLASKCEVWSEPTQNHPAKYLATLPITAGSVTEDETQILRRTLQLTAFDPTGTLAPNNPGDLLHPDTGNELRPYRGLMLPGGPQYQPLGVFRMTAPDTKEATDGSGIVITFQNNDRMEAFQDAGWLHAFLFQGNVTTQLYELTNGLFPGLDYDFVDSPHQIASVVFGGVGTLQQGSDPATDMTDAAQQCGLQLYFDENGKLILSDISSSPPNNPDFEWVVGKDCQIQEADKAYDRTNDFNVVVVEGTSSSASSPLRAVVYVPPTPQNPRVFAFQGSMFKTIEQITAAAYGFLYRLSGASETTTVTMTPDPRVKAGMTAQLWVPKIKAMKAYTVQAVTTPLESATQASVTLRPAFTAGMPQGLLTGGLGPS